MSRLDVASLDVLKVLSLAVAPLTIRRYVNVLWLVDDDPAGARAQLTRDAWISSTRGYHTQHWLELRARIEIAIGGEPGRDLAAAGERWMRDAGIKHPERMTYLVSPC